MNSEKMSAVVQVGRGGRGFVVQNSRLRSRLVITAGHCLPRLPPAHGASYTKKRTFKKLLGRLGGKRSVWTECIFVDPIADLAVLATPDRQVSFEEAEAYQELVESGELSVPSRSRNDLDEASDLRLAEPGSTQYSADRERRFVAAALSRPVPDEQGGSRDGADALLKLLASTGSPSSCHSIASPKVTHTCSRCARASLARRPHQPRQRYHDQRGPAEASLV